MAAKPGKQSRGGSSEQYAGRNETDSEGHAFIIRNNLTEKRKRRCDLKNKQLIGDKCKPWEPKQKYSEKDEPKKDLSGKELERLKRLTERNGEFNGKY